jgi:integrase/recombinase XerC
MLRRGADGGSYLLQIPTKPLQFPSLEHFDAATARAITRAEQLDGVQPTTVAWARASYRVFRTFLKGHGAVEDFLRGDLERQQAILEDWIIEMRSRRLSRGAINTYWRGLASVLRWQMRHDGVTNPMLFVATPRVGRLNPSFLPREAAEAVLAFVQNCRWRTPFEGHRNTAIIGVMLLAGLRRGEVQRLQMADVDIARGTLRIRKAKGPDGGRDRTAYMPPQLREMVRRYVEERRLLLDAREGRGKLVREPNALIVTAHAATAICAETINRICRDISRRMGVHVSPHMLRHSYATLLRQSGVPDRLAMELMGHADLRMLLRYSHVVSGETQAAADTIKLTI